MQNDKTLDSELLEACAAFHASYGAMVRYGGEEIETVLFLWLADLKRVAELPAVTADGCREKAQAAMIALRWKRRDEYNQAVNELVVSALMDNIEFISYERDEGQPLANPS